MGVHPLGCLRASSRPRGPDQWRPWGRSLYLDVSMFSSLKLLQCSITLLETAGERRSEGGLGSGGPGSPRQMRPLDLLANVSSDADADRGGVLGGCWRAAGTCRVPRKWHLWSPILLAPCAPLLPPWPPLPYLSARGPLWLGAPLNRLRPDLHNPLCSFLESCLPSSLSPCLPAEAY